MSEKQFPVREAIGNSDFFQKRNKLEKAEISASARVKRLDRSMIRVGVSFFRSWLGNRLQIAFCHPVSY